MGVDIVSRFYAVAVQNLVICSEIFHALFEPVWCLLIEWIMYRKKTNSESTPLIDMFYRV